MIRRTFALTGAAVLALGFAGLAGPAAADDAGVSVARPDAILFEFGVRMDTTVGGDAIAGTFIELKNTNPSSSVSLQGYSLRGCTATSGPTPLATFGPADVIPANGVFLIGNNAYASSDGPERNIGFLASVDDLLVQENGALELEENSTSDVHNVGWGMPAGTCSFDAAGVTPNDDNSLNWIPSTESWVRAAPTPGS